MYLFRKAHKNRLLIGRTVEGMAASCLYYACRKLKKPISFKEIVKETSQKTKRIQKIYRVLVRTFELKVPIMRPVDYLSKFIADLGLNYDFEKKVRAFIENLPFCLINGYNPIGICAGALYIIGKKEKLNLTQKKLSKVTGMTEATIRNKSREFENRR